MSKTGTNKGTKKVATPASLKAQAAPTGTNKPKLNGS
jgi:hypothetical protein